MLQEKTAIFTNALCLAQTKLSKEVYKHSIRVMLYVMCNDMIPQNIHDDCIITAMLHDVAEDADVDFSELRFLTNDIRDALNVITKKPKEDYLDYIKNIRSSRLSKGGQIAYWVKVADMKDHLSQTDTLTDYLKNKYMNAIPFLLP